MPGEGKLASSRDKSPNWLPNKELSTLKPYTYKQQKWAEQATCVCVLVLACIYIHIHVHNNNNQRKEAINLRMGDLGGPLGRVSVRDRREEKGGEKET